MFIQHHPAPLRMFPLRPYIRDPPPQLHSIHTIRNRNIQISIFLIIIFRQRILLIPLSDSLLLRLKTNLPKPFQLSLIQGTPACIFLTKLAPNLRQPPPQRHPILRHILHRNLQIPMLQIIPLCLPEILFPFSPFLSQIIPNFSNSPCCSFVSA